MHVCPAGASGYAPLSIPGRPDCVLLTAPPMAGHERKTMFNQTTKTQSESVPWRCRLFSGLVALTLTGTIAISGTASAAAAETSGLCDFAQFIGVRGTDAAAGAGLAHGNRVWLTGGHGDEVLVLKAQLKSSSPLPFYFESLNYPAKGGADYPTSVLTGRNTLINEINWIASQCAGASIVLAGHSQGAAVVLAALTSLNTPGYPELTARGRASIKAVAAFGDPNYRPNRAIAAPGNSTGVGLLGPRPIAYSDQLDGMRYWGWPIGGSAQGWVQKIRSWCYPGDFFCATGTGSNAMAIHNSYGTKAMTGARQWIEHLFSDF